MRGKKPRGVTILVRSRIPSWRSSLKCAGPCEERISGAFICACKREPPVHSLGIKRSAQARPVRGSTWREHDNRMPFRNKAWSITCKISRQIRAHHTTNSTKQMCYLHGEFGAMHRVVAVCSPNVKCVSALWMCWVQLACCFRWVFFVGGGRVRVVCKKQQQPLDRGRQV